MEIEVSIDELLWTLRATIRAAALLSVAPWPNAKAVPLRTRLVLALFVGPLLWLPHAGQGHVLPESPDLYALAILGDILLGAGVGLMLRIAYSAISAATAITGLQMGLTLSAVADPETGNRVEPIGRAYEWMAVALAIATGLHRYVLSAFADLFRPGLVPSRQGFVAIAQLGGDIFTIGLRLAAPAFICLFLVDMLVGLTGRLIPEVKAMMVIHSVKLLLGLAVICMALPITAQILNERVLRVPNDWHVLVARP